MMTEEIKSEIINSLKAFTGGNLTNNALKLFQTLGYITDRQAPLNKPTFVEFKDTYIEGNKFDETKAKVSDWKYVDLLFQLSKKEVAQEMFDDFEGVVTVGNDKVIIETYLFFAIELSKEQYSRTELSLITREVNRLFPMPAMILFRYGSTLTLSVINRRLHKKDESKDVLEKVTQIKDINIEKPHRAHIEILFELTFEELKRKHDFKNFVELHNAWQKTLDTKELNDRFYGEIFHWYLWALKYVRFPQIRPKDDIISEESHRSESVIRMLTRLLFCWFMKEKQQLIAESLFNINFLQKILKNFNPENQTNEVYYRAILQNLFFATLSVKIKDRKYIRESYCGHNKNYGNQYVFRYQNEFVNPPENLKIFKDIPFLNGGLFDCLDEVPRVDNEIKEEVRLDGFSNTKLNQAFVPDFIFWGEHKNIDLSKECDNPRKNRETVHGIFDILNAFKFTLEENTPLEEEIALDPELLGKVFENLLASYDPLTKTSTRKQTGSYYTPREIVNYMVDESLLAYLMHQLPEVGEEIFRSMLSYTEEETLLSEEEKNKIIVSIENLKILDPACGSGAFPMGMLHKLVFILGKVDPDNKKWFELLLKRMPHYTQSEMRKKLEGENWDYLRKLGIIQQSIYGIDIQPIAIQISKLRFFISLLVDQKIRDTAENNYGLMPLPNLDFKLVCANTLISASETDEVTIALFAQNQDLFYKEFEMLTNRYFSTYLPVEKKKVRKQIEELITNKCNEKIERIKNIHEYNPKEKNEKIRKVMQAKYEEHIQNKKNDIKLWESYKNLFKQKAVKFFDIKYFFPEVKEGFDVVIGNPPYVSISKYDDKDFLRKQGYFTYENTGDLYSLFYEKSNQLLKNKGLLSFITSRQWMNASYGKSTRKYFIEKTNPLQLIDFGKVKIFESATVFVNILVFEKGNNRNQLKACLLDENYKVEENDLYNYFSKNHFLLSDLSATVWKIGEEKTNEINKKIETIGTKLKDWIGLKFYSGIKSGYNKAFHIDEFTKNELIKLDSNNMKIIKSLLRGKDIKRYHYKFENLYIINTHNGIRELGIKPIHVAKDFPVIYAHLKKFKTELEKRDDQGLHWSNLRDCTYLKEFENEKIVWIEISDKANYAYDTKGMYLTNSAYFISGNNLKYILAILNSKLADFYFFQITAKIAGGRKRYTKQYVEQIPVIQIAEKAQQPFITLVNQILSSKSQNPSTDTSPLEKQIDEMVYKLYDLTDEEIKIIEEPK